MYNILRLQFCCGIATFASFPQLTLKNAGTPLSVSRDILRLSEIIGWNILRQLEHFDIVNC